jgi:hypothetical protein
MNNIITYLFIGTCWVLFLDITSYYYNTNTQLDSKEKIITALLWPITFIIFVYHFIKSWFNNEV